MGVYFFLSLDFASAITVTFAPYEKNMERNWRVEWVCSLDAKTRKLL